MVHCYGVINIRHIRSNLMYIPKKSTMVVQVFIRVAELRGGCCAHTSIGIIGTDTAVVIAVAVMMQVQWVPIIVI